MKKCFNGIAVLSAISVLALFGLQTGRAENPEGAARWRPIGPEGGAIAALSNLRDQPDEVMALVGTSHNGPSLIFKSVNGGLTWAKVAVVGEPLSDVKRDPSNPAVLYGLAVDRIFKSQDGGASWSQVLFDKLFYTYGRIVIDPLSPRRIYVSGSYKYKSYDTCLALAKSTDGGATWKYKKVFPTSSTGQAAPVAIDPKKPSTIYLGGYAVIKKFFPRLCKSLDGGETWSDITGPISGTPADILIDPVNPKNIFVGSESGLFISVNGGESWQKSAGGIYAGSLAIDPADPGIIYAGADLKIFKSRDGGRSWMSYTTGLYGAVSGIVPLASRVLAGTNCGLFGSADGGQNWRPSHSGIAYSQAMALAVAPSAPENIYASVYGLGLFFSPNGGAGWEKRPDIGKGLEALIEEVAVDSKAPHFVYALFRGENNDSGIYRTPDAGVSWARILNKPVNELVAHPRQAGYVYAAGRAKAGAKNILALFVSADGGETWSTFPIATAWSGVPYSLACHPSDVGLVYLGGARLDKYRGVIHRTVDGGRTWSLSTYSHKVGDYPYSLAADPENRNLLLVGTPYGIYRSENGGQTWSLRPTGKPASSLLFDPKRAGVVYAGWTYGVLRSLDSGKSWEAFNAGLTVLNVMSLATDPSGAILYAAIHGGGIYRRNL